MYGLVNKALEDMVTARHGEAVWGRIRAAAGVDVAVFLSTEGYPDAVTYDLVRAASETLGVPAEVLLEQFGAWWVLHTARENYGHLLAAGGKDLREFLLNLPNFHTRISLLLPKLQPPEFECTDVRALSLRLHYRSTRAGLAPFVTGLIHGLGEMFVTEVDVSHAERREDGAAHDVFLVEWRRPLEA